MSFTHRDSGRRRLEKKTCYKKHALDYSYTHPCYSNHKKIRFFNRSTAHGSCWSKFTLKSSENVHEFQCKLFQPSAAPADFPPLSPSQLAVIAPHHPSCCCKTRPPWGPMPLRGQDMHTCIDHFWIRGPQLFFADILKDPRVSGLYLIEVVSFHRFFVSGPRRNAQLGKLPMAVFQKIQKANYFCKSQAAVVASPCHRHLRILPTEYEKSDWSWSFFSFRFGTTSYFGSEFSRNRSSCD